MKIKEAPIFRLISIFTLIAFILEPSLFSSTAYAEVPCWNDGSIDGAYGGDPSLPGYRGGPNPQGTQKAGDPVNVATGNYSYESLDITIPSREVHIEFKRFYNSQDDYNGPLGIGWNHNYNVFLVEVVDMEAGGSINYVIRHNAKGNSDRFKQNPDGSYSAPPGIFDTLTKDGQNYVITTKHGRIYRFNTTGYLASITDRNQNQIILTYDSQTGVLNKVSDALGRYVMFEYNLERKISKITDFTRRVWIYAYANGDLISVTTPSRDDFPFGTTITYAYDEHNISSITDARGNTIMSITYDSVDRVDTMTQGIYSYHFDYTPNLTIFYDRKGQNSAYVLNNDGTTSKMTQYPNYETSNTYNSDKLITKIVSPRGNSIENTYDNKGNRLEVRRKPKAGSGQPDIVTAFTYESRYNFIKTIRDPMGYTITCYYDYEEAMLGDLNQDGLTTQTRGNLVKITYPRIVEGTPETKFIYNSFGQVENIIDSDGRVTKYEYNPLTSYLYKVILDFGGLNLTSEMTYDLLGNLKSLKDPEGNTTTFEYNSHNNRIRVTSAAPFNYVTRYKYDANNNLIQEDKQTDNPSNPWQTTYYTYDRLNRLQSTTDDSNNTTTYSYDANDNLASIRDAELNVVYYEYDERGLLRSVYGAVNAAYYTYDENKNLIEIKDGKGNITTYTYNDFDRLIKITYANNYAEEYTYDANHNLLTKRDPEGRIFYYEYDKLNRMTQKGLFPKGSDLESVVNYVYYLDSRLASFTDSTGTTSYSYDSLNRLIQVTHPDAKSISYEYDSNSNRKKLTYPDSSYITYEYDELDRPTAIKDQSGNSIASYNYDALFRRTQANYANNTQAIYQYDAIDRVTRLTNQLTNQPTNKISEFVYTYDNIGNRKSMTTLEGTHNYGYDPIHRLILSQHPGQPDETYGYDDVGNRETSAQYADWDYDVNNRLLSYNDATFTYDKNGNTISKATAQETTTYSYDYENQLTQISGSTNVQYTYDPFGRRLSKTVNGTTTYYLYDGENIIAEYDSLGNLISAYTHGLGIDEPICKLGAVPEGGLYPIYYYHFDGLGSVSDLTDNNGTVVEQYKYDAFGNLQIPPATGNPYTYTSREYDAETGLYFYRARYYNPTIGRFITQDPIGFLGGVNFYSYVKNNPVNAVDPWGLLTEAQCERIMEMLAHERKYGTYETALYFSNDWGTKPMGWSEFENQPIDTALGVVDLDWLLCVMSIASRPSHPMIKSLIASLAYPAGKTLEVVAGQTRDSTPYQDPKEANAVQMFVLGNQSLRDFFPEWFMKKNCHEQFKKYNPASIWPIYSRSDLSQSEIIEKQELINKAKYLSLYPTLSPLER